LDIKILVPAGPGTEDDFCAQLEEYLAEYAPREKPFPYNPLLGRQKYGLLRKLRAADPVISGIELVGLPCKIGDPVSQFLSESKP